MKIFDADQVRKWDQFTITNEPISENGLMERAANACYHWIIQQFNTTNAFVIFCGRGNNGGDGLVIARLLIHAGYRVEVNVVNGQKYGTPGFEYNLLKLKEISKIHFLDKKVDFPKIATDTIVLDALVGTGLKKPLTGLTKDLCEYINDAGTDVIAIDIPSGLLPEQSSVGYSVVNASYTLSFQQYKLSFLFDENEDHIGKLIILDIHLSPGYYEVTNVKFEAITQQVIASIYVPRKNSSHKGTFGNALLITGSAGMMGAAILSVKAALRSGAGKVTAFIPKIGYKILQTAAPEAMALVCGKEYLEVLRETADYNSIGIGPGIGRVPGHKDLLKQLFTSIKKPIVIDADALNEIAAFPELLNLIPSDSILTPHPKEFERLFGKAGNDLQRIQMAVNKAVQFNIYIVLKGHHTLVATPSGKGYFNTTGNPGMATGGSGDVLTGIITGLLAQGYSSLNAARMGVFIHGLSGDLAANVLSQEGLIAGDLIDYLPLAYKNIQPTKSK